MTSVFSSRLPPLGCIVLASNERHDVVQCLESLRTHDLGACMPVVVVVDDCSEDGTVAAALNSGALVIVRRFDALAAQRTAGAIALETEWIVFLDADERMTPLCYRELLAMLADESRLPIALPRRNFVLGGELKAGNWYPDWQVRVYRRQDWCNDVPFSDVRKLKEPILHYSHETWGIWYTKFRRATRAASQGSHDLPGFSVTLSDAANRLIRSRGYLDGWRGVITIAYLLVFDLTVRFRREARRREWTS